MARAQENPVANPPYLEFFGLTRPPFTRLADPSQTFHTEQYSLLMDHLANATQEPDSLVVICGADGSGKSTLLNRYITSLGNHISFVAIDEACISEKEFYGAFLTQIGFSDITGAASELKNITREFLIHRGMAGDSVLIIIDNAHLIVPAILDQIRWISDIKIKGRRVISVVLAGNADLVHVVDAPAMSQTKFRSHVLFNIRNYTEEETASYVWHRLRLAGGNDGVKIPLEAHPLIHRYSGGIPNIINKLCNDMLTEAHTLESRVITEALVRSVADNQQLMPHVIPLHGQGRRRTDPDYDPEEQERRSEERIIARDSTPGESVSQPNAATPDVDTINRQEHLSLLTGQVEDLRADKMRALSDISARDKDISTRDKEISELQEKLSSRTSELEVLTGTIAASAAESEQRNRALANSTTAFRDSEEASKSLADDLAGEKRAREAAQHDLASATATIEELSKLRAELQTAVSGLQDKLNSEIGIKGGELESLRDELETQNQTLADNTRELEQQYQALSDSAITLQESEKLATNLTADLETEIRSRESAEGDLVTAKASVAELGQLKQELLATVDDLKVDLEAAGNQAGEIEDLRKSTAELKDEAKTKTNELESLQGKLESKNESLADLEKQLESAQNHAATLKDPRALRKSEKASKKLNARLDEETDAREAAQNELAAATESAKELNQLNLELQTTVSDLQADLKVAGERIIEFDDLEKNAADLRDGIEKSGGELESLQDQLRSRDQAISDLEASAVELRVGAEKKAEELESVRIELDSRNQVVVDLKKDAADLKKDDQEKSSKLESLGGELESSNQTVADLEKDTADLKEDAQEKASKLESLGGELKSSNQTVADLETNVVDLKDLVGWKSDEMESLRDDLESRNHALAEFEELFDESQKELDSAQLHISELTDPEKLQEREEATRKLTDQLEEQTKARESAENDLATGKATIEELGQLKLELQTTISDLQSDLKVAGEKVVEINALEQNTADLKDGIEKKGGQLQSLREELKSRHQAVADLEKKTADLNAKIGEKDGELESLRDQLNSRDQSLAEVEESAAHLEDDVGKKAGDLEALRDKLSSRHQAVADLEKKAVDLNAEIGKKDDELESLRNQLSSRDQSLAAVEKSAANLEDDVGKKAGDLESLQEELKSRHQAVADLEKKSADLNTEIWRKDSELESLRDQLNSRDLSLADFEKNAANLEDDVGRKAGDLEALRDELSSRHQAVADLEKKAVDLNAEIGRKDDELGSLRDQLNSRDQSLAEVEKSAASLEDDVGKRAGDLESLQDELNSRHQAVADLEKKTAVLNAEIEKNSYELESLRDELSSRDQSLADFERNAAHLEDDVGKKAGDLESLRDELESRNDSITELEKSTADLNIEVGEKANELETLRNELASRDRSLADVEKYAANLNDDVQGRDGKLESLQDDLDSRNQALAELEKNVADLKGETQNKSGEVNSMQDELDARNQAFADLHLQLDQSQRDYESAQRRVAELKNPKALRKSEKLSKKLANKLEKEVHARASAQKDLATAKSTVKELKQLKKELQAANRDLNADLTVAGERVVETGIVERNAATLKEKVEEVTGELSVRDTAFAEIQDQLEASQNESEALRLRVVAMENAMASGSVAGVAAVAVTDQGAGEEPPRTDKQSSKSMKDEPAYKALREFDRSIYDRLIARRKKLSKKGRSEKQIDDALRTEQAELTEKLLTRASDQAVLAYARLIIAQLNDFQLDGSEPSFKLLLPRTDDDDNGLPIYSERTRERELAVLETTLNTYDAERTIPQEEDVWPDLEPIFIKLFDAYGEDNVSALQNSYAPDIGKDVVCKISRSLYSRILKLPEAHAAKALRWLLSP